ncbi:DNA methyltransferase [Cyanobacterium aponinum AL20118]|uniref:site-specific DNA-methyltransferase (adenine-specific) n=1 Tax=Cyanobacterium aponinum AL20115 TaxID=3090662 RepID=A0AAF0ZGK7_9CHRO|nr:DNA methyltransferase [Cyanobacterium aponinum]WPF88954.1 DNA methyltransferase [Cyanobacterium aponinum AL20115]
MPLLSWNEIKNRALIFSQEWQGEISEKAESQSFWNDFFNVFGISRRRVATFEESVKKLGNKQGFIDLFWKGVILIEHKSRGKNLDKAYQQAIDYFPNLQEFELPKYILVSDFERFRLYDLDSNNNHEFLLKDFINYVHLFDFIAGYKKREYKEGDPVNIQAAELMGELHDRLLNIGYDGHNLEVYLVRLLFCLFADDTGIFNKGIFQEYIDLYTKEDGSDLAMHLGYIFYILNQPENKRLKNLDENLAQFPYINGKLFEEVLPPASFDSEMRQMLLKASALDWGKISPAIFGSMFQAVMNPQQRRNLGAHYTSEKNIQKVIKPLFLDDLYEEFYKIKNSQNKLKEFQAKLAQLKFLDPACGCGNFLIVSYRELRDLEILVLKELQTKGQLELDISNIIKVDVDQFYGIEYDEFAVRVAEVAMWLIDHQMNMKVSNEFGQYFVRLPLKKSANIIHGNALQIDWHSLLNPPPLKEGLGVVESKSLKDGLGVFELTSGKETTENNYPTYKSISNLKDKKELRKSLRNNATSAEQLLWKALQGKQLDGFKFRRQHSIGNYILDFFCPSVSLAIELDGETHYTPEAQEYDRIRDNFLANVGIRVIRYHNHDVCDNLTGVLEDIRQYLYNPDASFSQRKSITSNPSSIGESNTPNPSSIEESTTPNPSYIEESTTPNPSYIGGENNGLGEVNNFDFIFGNPPFVGKSYQNAQQKADMSLVFNGVKNAGVLDYVCAWYLKASQYLNPPQSPLSKVGGFTVNSSQSSINSPTLKEGLGVVKTRCAFVSTSSISQGEQVGVLWQELYTKYKIKIQFAHRTFSWSNEAKNNAGVHCVIIGFGLENIENKRLFSYENIRGEATEIKVKNINPYLVAGNDLIILKRAKPISNIPQIMYGSKPTDGGNLLIDETEKMEYLKIEKIGEKFIKSFISADEFINGKNRYCFWLVDIQPSELKQLPLLLKRVEAVKKMRLASTKKATQKWAEFPTLFAENRQPKSDYILIPLHSSENRKYIPIGFFNKDNIVANSCSCIPNADLFLFGILTSEMHMTWVKYVCGRLKSDYRYSNSIVYNNFPFPENVTAKQKEKVTNLAQKILDIRNKYTTPNPSLKGEEKGASLADLYDPLTMPPDLLKAHQALDKAVDSCYRKQPFSSELNRIEFLFNLYENLTNPLLKSQGKKSKK